MLYLQRAALIHSRDDETLLAQHPTHFLYGHYAHAAIVGTPTTMTITRCPLPAIAAYSTFHLPPVANKTIASPVAIHQRCGILPRLLSFLRSAP